MSNQMTEKQVLRKLSADDFRTKEGLMKFANMMDKVDKDVQIAIVNQFENFSSMASDLCANYLTFADKIINTNSESTDICYSAYKIQIEECQKLLADENLSQDNKIIVLQTLSDATNAISVKDSENKDFLIKLATAGASVLGFLTLGALAILGISKNPELLSAALVSSNDTEEEDD